jgi:hypothetical protein
MTLLMLMLRVVTKSLIAGVETAALERIEHPRSLFHISIRRTDRGKQNTEPWSVHQGLEPPRHEGNM